ncbi:MAG TPA: PKD domain-containing protein [Chitinophagaceae bacterium]|nr:PKD domain-containing protein [Chitinophagaceae bacterium]
MKSILRLASYSLLISAAYFISCKKERSCEACRETNKPPIAIAGRDQVIMVPNDSNLLDGSASTDADGTISSWLWTKVSGPASFNITNTKAAKTTVKNLAKGIYQFELKVTDNLGMESEDTTQVIVNDSAHPIDSTHGSDSSQANRPPVANAGPDQTITLPLNTATLDGSGSTDPDNNITAYSWRKLTGPSSFIIGSANSVQTSVGNLAEGVYQFELKVTDAGGLFSNDTVQVTVNSAPSQACSHANWPIVNATLNSIGALSEPRIPFAAAAGTKVVFAGGQKYGASCCYSCDEWYLGSSAVDIYDVASHAWSVAQLSRSRVDISVATAGSKIFFAGGHDWDLQPGGLDVSYDNVDIYDASSGTWELAHLSKARQNMAVAAIGNKVFFAGGWFYTGNPPPYWQASKVVDIYDLATKSWSVSALSVSTGSGYVAVLSDKVYFMGGPSSSVDIYDNTTNTWSTADFQTVIAALSPPPGMGAIDRFNVVGDNIIFWSGLYQVGIRNLTAGTTSTACLSQPAGAVLVNNSVVFFNGNSEFDIYNPATGVWSAGVPNPGIPSNLYRPGFTVLNNTIYFGGGQYDNHCNYHNEVYSLTW